MTQTKKESERNTRLTTNFLTIYLFYYSFLLGLSVNEEVLSQDNTLFIVNSRTNAPLYVVKTCEMHSASLPLLSLCLCLLPQFLLSFSPCSLLCCPYALYQVKGWKYIRDRRENKRKSGKEKHENKKDTACDQGGKAIFSLSLCYPN